MPLLITPTTPLLTTSGLPVSCLYCLVDEHHVYRKRRVVEFTVGYYLDEPASTPDSGRVELPVNLTRNFALPMTPQQANAAGASGDPTAILEQFVQQQLSPLLPDGSTFETVS